MVKKWLQVDNIECTSNSTMSFLMNEEKVLRENILNTILKSSQKEEEKHDDEQSTRKEA